MTDSIEAILHGGGDINIDQAILHARSDAAQVSNCASAVSHHGRRELVARHVRCRRAQAVPPANDDEKSTQALDTRRHFRDNPRKGGGDGDTPTAT